MHPNQPTPTGPSIHEPTAAGHLEDLARALADRQPVTASGLSRAATAFVTATLFGSFRPLVLLAPSELDARSLAEDIASYFQLFGKSAAEAGVLWIPENDVSPYADMATDRSLLRQRLTALYRLATHDADTVVIVLSARALARKTIAPAELVGLSTRIQHGEEIDRDRIAAAWIRAGYARVPIVEEPGSFAVRGGVLDVFPPLYSMPIRIELFGEEVESIRSFDRETQRTLRELSEVIVPPARETIATGSTGAAELRSRIFAAADRAHHPSKATRQLLEQLEQETEFVGIETLTPAFHDALVPVIDYLPGDREPAWILFDPAAIRRVFDDELENAGKRFQDRLDEHRIAFPPEDHYMSADQAFAAISRSQRRLDAAPLEILDTKAGTPSLRFQSDDNLALRNELERARKVQGDSLIAPLARAIAGYRNAGCRVVIACASESRRERLIALLREAQVELSLAPHDGIDLARIEPGAPAVIARCELSSGFVLREQGLVVITADDVFGERRRVQKDHRRAARRAREALKGGVSDFSELSPGDFLVHNLHGVGQYQGLKKLPIQGIPVDFLHLEYSGGSLYLPVVKIGEVQRYVGAKGLTPRLDKLGGSTFETARRKVSQKVRALAEELLQLYAQRQALPGHAFPPADHIYRDFEATFGFEETPDQQKAIDDVLADMGEPRPMDRLVCGDVGYGKTEVALRAMLRAVLGGKQVAMLAPTTVLVEQHFQTMKQRFADWPIHVGKLSRFQARGDQAKTLRGLAEGTIDTVVGTHRLLSNDVRFKNLGLLVIDEEQRFGVAHKERLKKMRSQIDVLTLTATPIPRTLHLALTGLRDLSIIATPPADRRAIRTMVAREEDAILRDGIRRELERKGQVFFVSPRIDQTMGAGDRSLSEWAKHLQELVPEARIAIAHGKMAAEQLEKVMVDFVDGEYDVLLSTTIVEAGLDIPRANTMFVARADTFGLAQLYQLRGRIGRSHERAYCYLLVPAPETLSEEAKRRLSTLQRFTELGAGFAIASQDLEIRGAGELLGAKQSGSIAAVGFDAYTQMLEDAVAELRGESIHRERDPELNVDVPGYIPDDYLPEAGLRLSVYKRLASAEDSDEIGEILEEIADRFGPIPPEMNLLAELMILKGLARRLRALSLELNPSNIALALAEDTPLQPARVMELIQKPNSGYRLTPDMRLIRSFRETERKQPVEAGKSVLLELLACAT